MSRFSSPLSILLCGTGLVFGCSGEPSRSLDDCPGGKCDDVGDSDGADGWKDLHPFSEENPIRSPITLESGEVWVLQDGVVHELDGDQLTAIEVPGVSRVRRLERTPAGGAGVLSDDGEIRLFDGASWLALPDAPTSVSDLAVLSANEAWLASKHKLYALEAETWQPVEDFPGFGVVSSKNWNNRVSVSEDGHLWTTSAYHSRYPEEHFFAHFDDTSWETFEGVAGDIIPQTGGEALVEFYDTEIARYPGGDVLVDSRDFKKEGLPGGIVPAIRDIAVQGDDLWAVTSDFALHDDGRGWKRVALPAITEPSLGGVVIDGSRTLITGGLGIVEVAGGTADWLTEPPAHTYGAIRSVVHVGGDEFVAAAGEAGLLRIAADDTITSETLPEVAHASALTISEDGTLWAWAGQEFVDEDGRRELVATLWRKDGSDWEPLHRWPDFWYLDLRSLTPGSSTDSVELALEERLEEVDASGQVNLILEDEFSYDRVTASRWQDQLWIVNKRGDVQLGEDGALTEIDASWNGSDEGPAFVAVTAIAEDLAIAQSQPWHEAPDRPVLWRLTPEGVTALDEAGPLTLFPQAAGDLALLHQGESIQGYDGQDFSRIANVGPDWKGMSCAASSQRVMCVGSHGMVVSHPLP